jgi:GTP cyclohydrolase I
MMITEDVIRNVLIGIGENPDREGLLETPKRVCKALTELLAGYEINTRELLAKNFVEGACDEMVVLKDIEFTSFCEHHLLPIFGYAHVAYIPNGKVVGISKLARVVDAYAKRLQIQERMTTDIAECIQEVLNPKGVAVIINAKHMCMTSRGIKKQKGSMVTSAMRGVFMTDEMARRELLSMIRLDK